MTTYLNFVLKTFLENGLSRAFWQMMTSNQYRVPALFYLSVASSSAILVVSVFSLLQAIPLLILLGMGGIIIAIAQFFIEAGWIHVTTANSGLQFANIPEKINYAMSRRGSGWFYVQIFIDILYIIILILVRS